MHFEINTGEFIRNTRRQFCLYFVNTPLSMTLNSAEEVASVKVKTMLEKQVFNVVRLWTSRPGNIP